MALTPEEAQELALLEAEEQQLQQQQQVPLVSGLTPEEEQELAFLEQEELQIQQQAPPIVTEAPKQPIDQFQAARVGVEEGLTFGTRPFIAGLAGAAGAGFSKLAEEGKSIPESFGAAIGAFKEARQEAIEEEEEATKEFPGTTTAGKVAGTIATAPFIAAKGIVGAAKIGALAGTGEAIGRAESIGEAGEKIATGATLGAGTGVLLKAAEPVAKGVVFLAKKVFPKKAFLKVAEATTGVPKTQIDTFVTKTNQIEKLSKEVAGDFQEATNVAKEQLLKEIHTTRRGLGNQIGNALEGASPDKFIRTSAILDKINKVKSKLDPDLELDQLAEIDTVIELISKKGEGLTLNELFKVKELLQNRAKGAFMKNGQLFVPGKQSQRAAKEGLNEARNILNEFAPEIKAANNKLSQLHQIEDRMNKSLLKVGAPESSFLAAGSGLNKRNETVLKALGKITGTNPLEKAQELVAARAFSSPSLIPGGGAERTGFALSRLGIGGAAGAGIAKLTDSDPVTGGLIGAALTSPAALKKLIQASNLSGQVVSKAIGMLADPTVNSIVAKEAARIGLDMEEVRDRLKFAIGKSKPLPSKKKPKSKSKKKAKGFRKIGTP